MTKESAAECDDLIEARHAIDAVKEAFANAIEARQAELRTKEVYGPRAGWKRFVIRRPR